MKSNIAHPRADMKAKSSQRIPWKSSKGLNILDFLLGGTDDGQGGVCVRGLRGRGAAEGMHLVTYNHRVPATVQPVTYCTMTWHLVTNNPYYRCIWWYTILGYQQSVVQILGATSDILCYRCIWWHTSIVYRIRFMDTRCNLWRIVLQVYLHFTIISLESNNRDKWIQQQR